MPSSEHKGGFWLYNRDDGLYYDFYDEEMPEPKAEPLKSAVFRVSYESGVFGEEGTTLDYSIEQVREDNIEFADENYDDDPGGRWYAFTFTIHVDGWSVFCIFDMPYDWNGLVEFLKNVRENRYARQLIGSGGPAYPKLFCWPRPDGSVRFGLRESWMDGGEYLVDIVVEKDKLLAVFEGMLREAARAAAAIYSPEPCPEVLVFEEH